MTVVPYTMTMKGLKLLFIIFSTSTICYGQVAKTPRNLKQAVKVLITDCPDSLKTTILHTEDNRLKNLVYPYGGDYKTLYNWEAVEGKKNRLEKYFYFKGIISHQTEIILSAFKQTLQEGRFNEETVIKPFGEIEKQWKLEDERRFETDSLRGVYIPKNLHDCFNQINGFWSDSIKNIVREWSEDEFTAKAHRGFGMWMRNNWRLWGGSRLSKYFNDKGLSHPDDMSGIILTSYHRYLNNTEIDVEGQVQRYRDFWEKQEREAREEALTNLPNTYWVIPSSFITKMALSVKNKKRCITMTLVSREA